MLGGLAAYDQTRTFCIGRPVVWDAFWKVFFFLVSARMEEAAFNHVLETGLTHELKKGLPRYKDVPFSSGLPHP